MAVFAHHRDVQAQLREALTHTHTLTLTLTLTLSLTRILQAQLREAFGERAVGIDGDTPTEGRAEAVRRFQEEEEVRYLAITPVVGR